MERFLGRPVQPHSMGHFQPAYLWVCQGIHWATSRNLDQAWGLAC